MSNSYILILWLFLLAALLVTLWGWFIIAKARCTLRWPQVEGVIEQSAPSSEEDDLLPHIVFSYRIDGHFYRSQLKFPSGITPTPEFSASYLKRYPVGAAVHVHYNPEQPGEATLEPGMGQGDWMVFALGVIATLCATAFLCFGT